MCIKNHIDFTGTRCQQYRGTPFVVGIVRACTSPGWGTAIDESCLLTNQDTPTCGCLQAFRRKSREA